MKVIIIGCGRVGAWLAQTMNQRGHNVTVVDRDPAAFERLGPSFKGRTVNGIGFDRDVLIEAGIERCDALAVVTASDEVNVVTARLAKMVFKVPRVAARVYEPRKADIYRRLGLLTISPVILGAVRMAEMLSMSDLTPSYEVGSGEVDMVDIEIPPALAGRNLASMTVPGEVHVVAISRNGKTFLPHPGAVFQEGDRVHLAVATLYADRLRALLE
jgi:trk system potassium uptake protein TrkA